MKQIIIIILSFINLYSLHLKTYALSPTTISNKYESMSFHELRLFFVLQDDFNNYYIKKLLKTAEGILSGYHKYPYGKNETINFLNTKGITSLQTIQEMLLKNNYSKNDIQIIKKIIEKIPTANQPADDFFIDSFPDYNIYWLSALTSVSSSDYNNAIITIELSNYCSNNCLMCGEGKDEHKSKIRHMPFPMVIQIIKNYQKYGKKAWQKHVVIKPYGKTELDDYEDPVIKATSSDLIKFLDMHSISRSIINHGSDSPSRQNKDQEISEGIISFHLFHHDILKYITKKITGNIDSEQRKRLKSKYKNKFRSIMKKTLNKKGFEQRVIGFSPQQKLFLAQNNCQFALSAIQEFENLLSEILKELEKELVLKYPIKYDPSFGMSIVGNTIPFFRKLKIPDNIIKEMQNQKQAQEFMGYSAVTIKSDGKILFSTRDASDGDIADYRQLQDIWEELSFSKKEKIFAVMSVLLNIDSMQQIGGLFRLICDKSIDKIPQKIIKNLLKDDSYIDEYITELKNRKTDPNDPQAEMMKDYFIKDYLSKHKTKPIEFNAPPKEIAIMGVDPTYMDILKTYIYKSGHAFSDITKLTNELSEENMHILYEICKSIPIPLFILNYVSLANGEMKTGNNTIHMKHNIEKTSHDFEIPYSAFFLNVTRKTAFQNNFKIIDQST